MWKSWLLDRSHTYPYPISVPIKARLWCPKLCVLGCLVFTRVTWLMWGPTMGDRCSGFLLQHIGGSAYLDGNPPPHIVEEWGLFPPRLHQGTRAKYILLYRFKCIWSKFSSNSKTTYTNLNSDKRSRQNDSNISCTQLQEMATSWTIKCCITADY